MSTKKPTPAGSVTFDVSSVATSFEQLFGDADALRAAGLTSLANTRTARTVVMQRERDNVAATLGANAPEVTQLDAAIADDTALAKSLSAQGTAAAQPPVTAAADETVVQGVVRDATGKPASGVKVSLAEPKGDVLTTTSSAKDGHFVLRHKAAAKTEVADKIEVRVHDKRHPTPIELERGNGVAFVTVNLEG
ncbi:MAG: carboxypeptidase-like regulatory domain-containing protein [Kofleriaceae bacterium]